MASGTLFGIGLSQQHDLNGVPMVGCLLYLYEANSSTPVISYKDTALTPGMEHTWPIVADGNGRIPAFWLDAADNYRARLTDADGIVQFDELNIMPIGAVAGDGGGGDTTDPNSIATTGDVKWRPSQEDLIGWVKLNGETIGSAVSGADNAANNLQALFEYLWANFTDAFCPVLPGPRTTANGDWIANKTIQLLDMRGRAAFGLDDMGSSNAGVLGTDILFQLGGPFGGGSYGGLDNFYLAANQIPALTIDVTEDSHVTVPASPLVVPFGAGTTSVTGPGAANVFSSAAFTALSINNHTFTAAYVNASQQAVDKMPPFMVGTWYQRI